jgi:hypothetical protein
MANFPENVFSPGVDSLDLRLSGARPLSDNPAVVYLASLSEGSRRRIFQSLSAIARLLTDGQLDVFSLDWAALRAPHTAYVRDQLAARYRPATANKMLSALRRVLYYAWSTGQMSDEEYVLARSFDRVSRPDRTSQS